MLESIDVSKPVGLRDRALIALLIYTFARVSAALHMNVAITSRKANAGGSGCMRKAANTMRCPPIICSKPTWMSISIAASIGEDKASPLFRTALGRTGQLTNRRMNRRDALRMIWRRARTAGIPTELGCHSFRATGITVYLMNGGLLEHAQQMAAHESARTTKLYDRRNDKITLDEVERIVL